MNSYRLAAIAVVASFFTILGATVLLPMVLFNPQASGSGNVYAGRTPGSAVRGRQIYIREGCMYCHSQFTRLQDRGLGPLVKAGDYVFETPHQLGTARTGPDLTNEGGKFPDGWQKAHLINPRAMKPGSIMPSFSYLSSKDMDDLVGYIQSLGDRRGAAAFVEAPAEYTTQTQAGRLLAQRKHVDTGDDASANAGRGLYTQNCAACHGLEGRGNGPNSISLEKKPADFTRAFFKQYSDEFWFYRISEGVAGTRMPRFAEALSEEQRWYLVAYLKTLPQGKAQSAQDLGRVEGFSMEMRHSQEQWDPPFGGGQ